MERMFVGIDVAKDRLDVHVRPSGEAFSVARDGKGLDELVARLRKLDVALIVLEATGGFETAVAGALCAAGLPLAVVNPRQIRAFARAVGRLAKSDTLDAVVNAHFAEAVRPDPRPVPDEQARSLSELITRRRQIVEMMTVERNRRGRLTNRRMIKSVDRLLKALQRELSDLEADLDETIRGTPAWRETEDLFKSVPGIGHRPLHQARPAAHCRHMGHAARRRQVGSSRFLWPVPRCVGVDLRASSSRSSAIGCKGNGAQDVIVSVHVHSFDGSESR